jgi:release factor glutamine methyltransferase
MPETISHALLWARKKLNKSAGKFSSPDLDAVMLLARVLKKPKEFLHAYPEKKLTAAQLTKYRQLVARRAKHEPVAYILGEKEFYGFDFTVNKNVLIPRPDTEILIDEVVKSATAASTIIDIGTGSGAIAITLKKLLPKASVFAIDTSSAALSVARKNAKRLSAKIIFKKGDLLAPLKNKILRFSQNDTPIIITANLPYLSRDEWKKCQPEIKKYEPYSAFVGGKTGLEIYKKLFEEINHICHSRRRNDSEGLIRESRLYIFIEIGHNQKSAITKLAKKILRPSEIEFTKDLSGKWRVARMAVGNK